MTVEAYIAYFLIYVDACRFQFMHYDDRKLVFAVARFGGSLNTALGIWHKRWREFNRNGGLPTEANVTLLEILYIRCAEDVGYAERILGDLAKLWSSSNLSDDIEFSKVMDQLNDMLPFLRTLMT